jgi:GNAT superfamily N-acetyltransferase
MRDKREHMADVKNVNPYELDRQDGFSISTDPARLDLALIHDFLSRRSYWAREIPLEIVRRSIENSLCFGLYHGRSQVGFARVVTDKSTFAYLGDVFVLEDFRGRGLGKWLLERIVGHPELQGLRRFILATRDAHGLYEQFGYRVLSSPDSFMEIHRPEPYASTSDSS